jgi:hypothetical protein
MRYKGKIFRTLASLLVFLYVLSPAAETGLAFAAWLDPPVEATGKNDVGVNDDDDVENRIRKANVLFFLDTSHPMMFEPRGRLPYVVESSSGNINSPSTLATYGYNAATAIQMMQYATFGVGTVPPVDSFFTAKLRKWVHYGRETDFSNNLGATGGDTDINAAENKYRYYSPYAEAGHNLQATFINQQDAYSGTNDYSGLGYAFNNTAAIRNNRPLPYMLVFKNPLYWENGMPGFSPNIAAHREQLVPNDSRLYQTKLVMWRLLEDRILFENIRFGMSTVYTVAFTAQSAMTSDSPSTNAARTTPTNHVVYKVNPWGINNTYQYGAYYINSTGTTWSNTSQTESVQGGTWGIYGTTGANLNRQRRAFLRVPIAESDKKWTTKGGKVTMTHMERFRQWIDGVEDMAGQLNTGSNQNARDHDLNANQFDIHRNPELKVSSPIHLSRTIFFNPNGDSASNTANPNRAWYFANQGVAYAKKSDIFYDTSTNDLYNFYFKPGSGQAVGSVLDFFSPDYGKFGSSSGVTGLGYTNKSSSGSRDSERFADLIDEQFPIRDKCDPNYVVLLTAGDNSPSDYPLENAVKALYDHTKNNNVTQMYYENGERKFREVKLDQPIKTIVVGFIDTKDNSETGKKLQETLKRAARAGQGYDPGDTTAPVQAYFADNVPKLLDALREIMVIINNDIQPAKEPMLEGDQLDSDDLEGLDPDAEKLNLYAASYRINIFDQWEGTLTKYVTAKNKLTGEMETKEGGELGDKILKRRGSTITSNPRNLKFWNGGGGGNFEPVGFTGKQYTNITQHPLAALAGLDFNVSTTTELDTSFMADNTFAGKLHPSRAMFDWYYGYDVSYIDKQHYERTFMLADQGRSGIVKAGAPEVVNSLPGFADFAKRRKDEDDPVRLYVQTNDGVLHVVDPGLENGVSGSGMREELAILPPPTLLPRRIFSLKTTKQDGKYRWIDVNEYLANTSDDIPISSVPAYILDGPLQLRYFDMDTLGTDPDWRGLLFGSLGRGGSGLYVMDATDAVNPRFSWYRETVESDDVYLRHIWRAQGTSAPAGLHAAAPNVAVIPRDDAYWLDLYQNPDNHPYEQLGFNPPKPYFSVAEIVSGSSRKYQNLVALAGGMQNKLDLANNGTMGAALYLVDPDERFHGAQKPGGVKVFNSGSLKDASWRLGSGVLGDDPYMGMVNSEPVFLATRQSNYVARGAFFSDNRGNIFYITFENPETNSPYDSWDDWKIYTVASLRGQGDDPTDSYSNPWGLMGGSRRGSSNLWVGGGTANAARADPPDDDTQHLYNKSQMIFAFLMPNITDGKISVRGGMNRGTIEGAVDWAELSTENNTVSNTEGLKKGWYIPLQKEDSQYNEEYVTMRPILFGGNLYVATFMQEKISTGSSGACDTSTFMGKARLYAISLEGGRSVLWNDGDTKYLEFDGIKFVNATVSEKGDTVTAVFGFRRMHKERSDSDIRRHTGNKKNGGLSEVKGLDALVLRLTSGGGNSPVVSNDSMINYWLYK